ncbi:UbiA prenyltransferase family protein [Thermoproteota archaeon]
MEKLLGIIRLLRLERALSAMVGVVITGVMVKDLMMFKWDYLAACLAVFFSALANFALNDFHDVEVDRINRRKDRPLVNGVISPNTAVKVSLVAILVAFLFASQLNPVPEFMIMLGLPLSLVYNLFLKRYLFFKNLFTGMVNVGVILLGALVTDTIIEPIAYYMAVIGFFFSISYEIMLDIADVEGDKTMGIDTVPGRFGRRNAAYLSVLIGAGAVFTNPLPFFISVDSRLFRDYLFLGLILVPIINRLRISWALLRDQSPENILRLKKRLFRNLQFGGLCYLIGFLV